MTRSEATQLIAPVRRRWWLIVLATVIAGIATYVVYDRETPEYRTATRLLVKPSEVDQLLNPEAAVPSDRELSTQTGLLLTDVIAARVARDIGYAGSAGTLLGEVTASPDVGSDFLTITSKSTSPRRAALVANGFAHAFIEQRNGDVKQRSAAAIATARRQLQLIGNGAGATAQRGTIRSQIRQLQVIQATPVSSITQLDPAPVPGSPFSPRTKRNALFGAGIAFLLAVALAYVLERFDPRVRDLDSLAEAFGMPLVGSIPHARDTHAWEGEAGNVMPVEAREAFRILRSSVQLRMEDRDAAVLVVTSATPGEGKSTVARNLALAFYEVGARVAVIDGDLRRPSMHTNFNLSREPGLAEVALDGKPPRECLQAAEAPSPASLTAEEGTARLAVLASGRQVENAPLIVESNRLRDAIVGLRADHDLVIIDSPPVLAVADAVALARRADAAIVVARAGRVRRRSAERASGALTAIDALHVIGLVANDLKSRETSRSYGYYGYQATNAG